MTPINAASNLPVLWHPKPSTTRPERQPSSYSSSGERSWADLLRRAAASVGQSRTGDLLTLRQTEVTLAGAMRALEALNKSSGPGQEVQVRPQIQDLLQTAINQTRALLRSVQDARELETAIRKAG